MRSSNSKDARAAANPLATASGTCVCTVWDIRIGAPISRVMVSAMSGSRFSIEVITASRRSRRSATLISGSNAARAALTAASTSATEPAGTLPMTSSVAGSTTSIDPVPDGDTHRPSMKTFVRS